MVENEKLVAALTRRLGEKEKEYVELEERYSALVYYCEEGTCFATVTAKNPESDVRGILDGILDDVSQEKLKKFVVVGNIHEPEWKQYGEYFQSE